MAGKLEKGQSLLLENLRFHRKEEANDEKFSKQLANLADDHVNTPLDRASRPCFDRRHHQVRAEISSGLLMEKELEYHRQGHGASGKAVCGDPGGAKVSDKIEVIKI